MHQLNRSTPRPHIPALRLAAWLCAATALTWSAPPAAGGAPQAPASAGSGTCDSSATSAARTQMLDRFLGEWQGHSAAAEVVKSAIEGAISSMNVFTRGIARSRLLSRNVPPDRIRIRCEGELFVMIFGDTPAHRLPISGAPVQLDDVTLRLQLDEPHVALRHVGENEEGKRESLFHVKTPDVLIMEVVVTSPRLPGPVRYTLQFTRERRAGPETAVRGQPGE